MRIQDGRNGVKTVGIDSISPGELFETHDGVFIKLAREMDEMSSFTTVVNPVTGRRESLPNETQVWRLDAVLTILRAK